MSLILPLWFLQSLLQNGVADGCGVCGLHVDALHFGDGCHGDSHGDARDALP